MIDWTRSYSFLLLHQPVHYLSKIYTNLELTKRSLSKIDHTWSIKLDGSSSIVFFFFCSCTSQGTSCQKYTQTLNSQIGLSNDRLNSIDRTWLYLFFALAPARALAVKNIFANLELTNRFLLIIDPTGSCLFFCSCTSQGTSYQKYTQTLNS